jgi:tricorn protease
MGGDNHAARVLALVCRCGLEVENYGADPDIDLDTAPHEFRQGKDPQLDRGVAELLNLFEIRPPFRPMRKDDPRQV